MTKVTAIIPAAGRGRRMAAKLAKPYLMLNGKPILVHTLQVLENISLIGEIIVVVSASDKPVCQRKIIDKYSFKKIRDVVEGGASRTQSVYNGLKKVGPRCKLVLIHDGIRPFITEQIVKQLVKQADIFGAAISAVPAICTVKEINRDMFVRKTLSRDRLWMVQTPQVFKRELIYRAHQKAGHNRTVAADDAVLVERIGHKVKVVRGETDNIKITTPEDLLLAEVILKRRERGR